MTHEKVTSWGKASPALKPLVAILNIGLSIEEREREREIEVKIVDTRKKRGKGKKGWS